MRIGVVTLALVVLGAAGAGQNLLPRSIIVGLGTVQKYFPQVAHEQYSGSNSTAAGSPTATRSVIFVNGDASKKVTVTVDWYANARDASAAYREAVSKSKIPGFSPLKVPSIGQATFAGRVTQGKETHVGLGTLDGNLIIGATLAGYPATSDNLRRLVALTVAEQTAAARVPRTSM
jgi:hypothetical protein